MRWCKGEERGERKKKGGGERKRMVVDGCGWVQVGDGGLGGSVKYSGGPIKITNKMKEREGMGASANGVHA